jgi:hypothetical protein
VNRVNTTGTTRRNAFRETRDALAEARSLIDGNPPNLENCQHALQSALTALGLLIDLVEKETERP